MFDLARHAGAPRGIAARRAHRDAACFPGSGTRATLARVLVRQLEGALARGDADGARRSCALVEAIWADTPAQTRADLVAVARGEPDEAAPILRAALVDGDAGLATELPAIPPDVLRDLALLPDEVVRAICARSDFAGVVLPHVLRGRESARVVVARLHPAPLPVEVREALTSTVRQGDSALADTLAGRRDGFGDNLAADLAAMTPRARIARLRHAAGEVTFEEAPAPSPLLATIGTRVAALAEAGETASALLALASLMRVPHADVARLSTDGDPTRLALCLKAVGLDPALCERIVGRSWRDHAGRSVVEGTMGYAVARAYLADLRQITRMAEATRAAA